MSLRSVVECDAYPPIDDPHSHGYYTVFDDNWKKTKLHINDGVQFAFYMNPCESCQERLYVQVREGVREARELLAVMKLARRIMWYQFICETVGGQKWGFGPKRSAKQNGEDHDGYVGIDRVLECREKGHLFNGAYINHYRNLEEICFHPDDKENIDKIIHEDLDNKITHRIQTVHCARCFHFVRVLDVDECQKGWTKGLGKAGWAQIAGLGAVAGLMFRIGAISKEVEPRTITP